MYVFYICKRLISSQEVTLNYQQPGQVVSQQETSSPAVSACAKRLALISNQKKKETVTGKSSTFRSMYTFSIKQRFVSRKFTCSYVFCCLFSGVHQSMLKRIIAEYACDSDTLIVVLCRLNVINGRRLKNVKNR